MGKHKGFTLIEVALFLAVTAALFLGVALGVQNSIYQQRRNDSVQNFLEFMRSIYSKVSNPQSQGEGNSSEAIYGKLVVFGENVDLLGNNVSTDESPVFVYDVIGRADTNISDGGVVELLKGLDANVIKATGERAAESISPEKYEPRWGAGIENEDGNKYTGSIMVVRHPKTGTINTLVMKNVAIQVNEKMKEGFTNSLEIENFLVRYLGSTYPNFTTAEVDFCVNPNGVGVSAGMAPRQDIRITENARNASSVKMIDLDGSDNKCNR